MSYSEELNTTEEFNIIENNNVEEEPIVENEFTVQEEESTINETELQEEAQPDLTEVVISEEEPIIQSSLEEESIQKDEGIDPLPEFVNVKIKFPNSATPIDCVSAATNCREKIVAANKQIRLLQNRFYFIPVDCDERIDSDNYGNIKVYSSQADKIDVRYIKNKLACIIAMKHNIKLYDDELLAVLY